MKKPALIASMLAALAAGPSLADAPKGDAARGQALYMKNLCYTCHGTAGQGGDRGSGPRIAPNVWPWEGFAQQTRRPRESMPRYPVEQISDQELADVYAYLVSVKPGAKASEIPLLKD
jgi:mono/diheme cytochrome c family protein